MTFMLWSWGEQLLGFRHSRLKNEPTSTEKYFAQEVMDGPSFYGWKWDTDLRLRKCLSGKHSDMLYRKKMKLILSMALGPQCFLTVDEIRLHLPCFKFFGTGRDKGEWHRSHWDGADLVWEGVVDFTVSLPASIPGAVPSVFNTEQIKEENKEPVPYSLGLD